ncbi:UDP-glucose dehydrogenase family protein [Longibacter sp.]|uniref:UDP-glucose dehydrogenase family protein n=1 Tax=Longibacter sp. TaxID=2045415 RepID=UPI003EC0D6C5
MNIAIIGTGYVGLVSGTCFAEMGNQVTCVDIDEDKVDMLRGGRLPIYEPDLEHYFARNRKEGRLTFTTSYDDAVLDADVIFLALPTPPGEDGSADLSYVLQAAGTVADLLIEEDDPGYKIVVNKSTVPVGTADRVSETMSDRGLTVGEQYDVVSNPEFLREGAAVDDFMKPDRVVIGTSSEKAADKMTRLYEPFVRQGNPILVVDERSAEMIKYTANSILATRISFMNEIANLCERVGADVDKVRLGISKDHRIGRHFLYAGIGFGGSCFPKDVQALHRTGRQNGYEFQILDSVLKVNDQQRELMVHRLDAYFDGDLEGKKIAMWGLAFKPNTDDVREAPSHVIIEGLLERGADIVAFDPEAIETTKVNFGDRIGYTEDMYAPLEEADALVICTEWHEFRRPDLNRVREALKDPVVFDGRNLYEPSRMAEMGFDYFSIGRPHVAPQEDVEAIEAALSENGQA